MKNATFALFGVMFALSLGACDDDESGSGLDGSKVASELNDAEAKDLCEYVLDSLPNISNAQTCTLAGAAYADDEASCKLFYNDCVAGEDNGVDGDCSNPKPQLAGCEATIAELETCFEARNQAVEANAKRVTCADAAEVTLADLTVLPDECLDVIADCPQLMAN